ncbi:MAG: energy transducer TonB [Saprospiraceae bacterium]
MKVNLVILFVFYCSLNISGQNNPPPPPPKIYAEPFHLKPPCPYYFSGCEEESDKLEKWKCSQEKIKQFFLKHLTYPERAAKLGVEGKVVVQFIVEKDGSISNIKIVRELGAGCDEEVLRVVHLMPTFSPGNARGRAYRCKCFLPVSFKLFAESR